MQPEILIGEIERRSGVARMRTEQPRVEWAIERARVAVAPYEIPDLLVEFWRSYPDGIRDVIPMIDGVNAPFAGLCGEDGEYPQQFLPIGYESHTYIMLELGVDRSLPGTVWVHYFIDGDFEDHGTLSDHIFRCLYRHDEGFEPRRRSPLEETWPSAWRKRPLSPSRFDPPSVATGEVAASPFDRVWIEGSITVVPNTDPEVHEYLIDDGSGPVLLLNSSLTAMFGTPPLPRLDRRRLGPPLPEQRFRLQVRIVQRPGEESVERKSEPLAVCRIEAYHPPETIGDFEEHVLDPFFMLIQDEQDAGKTTSDIFRPFEVDISDIESPDDVMGIFGQIQAQACEMIEESRERMVRMVAYSTRRDHSAKRRLGRTRRR